MAIRKKQQQPLEERWAGVAGMPEALAGLDSYEKELLEREPASGSADAAERDNRLAVLPYLRAALGTLDPVLASPEFVQQLSNAITHASRALRNAGFQSQGQEREIVNLTRSLAVADGRAPVARIVNASQELQERVKGLQSTLEAANRTLTVLEEERTAFESQVQERIERTSELVDRSVESITAEARDHTDRKLADIEADRVTAVKAYEDSNRQADKILAEMREKLSIATDTALSQDYAKAAEAETNSANRMRSMAIVFGVVTGLVALAGVLLQVFIGTQDVEVSAWSVVPGKLAVVAAFGAVAGWLGRESNRHRAEAHKLRRTELQLRNLGSFLAELEPSDRNEARKQLLPRFFNDEPVSMPLDGPSHVGSLQAMSDTLNGNHG